MILLLGLLSHIVLETLSNILIVVDNDTNAGGGVISVHPMSRNRIALISLDYPGTEYVVVLVFIYDFGMGSVLHTTNVRQ